MGSSSPLLDQVNIETNPIISFTHLVYSRLDWGNQIHKFCVISAIGVLAISLAGCATTSATSMSKDVVKIDISSAPVCQGDTNNLMMQRAGIETIQRGYDKYILLDHGTGSVITGVNQYGHVSRAGRGSVVVKMFKEDDPAGANALSARDLLGPNWQEIVAKGPKQTCL